MGNDVMTEKRKRKIYRHLAGIYNLSPVTDKEPYFSKAGCPCCGDVLMGNRYTFTGTVGKKHTDKRIELVCCVDCYTWFFT